MKCQLIHQLRDKIGLKLTWRVTFLLFFSKTIDSLQCVTKHIWGSHALKRRRGVKFLPLSHEKKWCNDDFLRTEACKCQTGNFRQILVLRFKSRLLFHWHLEIYQTKSSYRMVPNLCYESGNKIGHIVFMLFLNLGKTWDVQCLSDFCTSTSSPTPMRFFVVLRNFSQIWQVSKTINFLWIQTKSLTG